ncbi:Ger(x)C family spore germination protein [Paenibacillus sp. JDR-2]|uniref:Ger(x)C family spore germination protein n=1 Tax=Paenibacillus sp. (strain JDR-2) TaxID=324057 RepID=UPI0001663F00|nr:Ger(x)C family spore germination protein [Paenibacillus sp. JDR-2]ACT02741.1 germination protein, Ger(x)C family [Paenibacillus sp. JDR-2]
MNKLHKTSLFFLFLSLALVSGCWDNSEVNEIAVELGWGIDKSPDKGVMISAQVIIPARIDGGQDGKVGGGKDKPFFVVSGDGMNTLAAVQQMQAKLSRLVFRGHRRVIVIGESMARRGIKDVFDTYTRDPNLKLRTDIFIVKGATANEFLKTTYPLENISALGVLGEYDQIGTPVEMGLLNFLHAATSEGACPAIPAVAIGMDSKSDNQSNQNMSSNPEGFQITGTGIFNKDLKLVGFLNIEEGRAMRWVTANLNKLTVPATIPDEEGNVSIILFKLHSKIQPTVQNGKLKFLVTLTANGAIRENNTRLDLTRTNNISLVQNALDRRIEETVSRTISKVQKEYGADIFGFSDTVKRKNLALWKSVSNDWEKEFREAEVSVKANITVRRIGVTGPALQLKSDEVKK